MGPAGFLKTPVNKISSVYLTSVHLSLPRQAEASWTSSSQAQGDAQRTKGPLAASSQSHVPRTRASTSGSLLLRWGDSRAAPLGPLRIEAAWAKPSARALRAAAGGSLGL